MQDGFVKVAVATPAIQVADCAYNAEQCIACIEQAKQKNVQLLVLPELCITGYTCADLFFQTTLLEGALSALKKIASYTKNIVVAIGLPLVVQNKLYNCAAICADGKIIGCVPKSSIPAHNEFYETRYFSPAPPYLSQIDLGGDLVLFGANLLFQCQQLPSFCFGIEMCEELSGVTPPSVSHAVAGATVILNLAASNEVVGKKQYRRNLVVSQSGRLVCAYLYACAGTGESTTDLIFAGHNILAENGVLLAESELFADGLLITEIDTERLSGERKRISTFPAPQTDTHEIVPFSLKRNQTDLTRAFSPTPFIPTSKEEQQTLFQQILSMQACGLQKRLAHTHAKTAVLGISGGLDSALALLVCVRAMKALGRSLTDIIAVTMPCFGTTNRTKSNAERLSELLDVTLKKIPIDASVNAHFADIQHDPETHDVTYENAQARERTQVLMDIANQTGGLVVGTGDLSELALGWATYNGDHMSMYGVNSGIPKTLIRYLIDYEAKHLENNAVEEVLQDILETPVSPELLPSDGKKMNQKTEEIVGPYELHDFFLYYVLRWGFSPKKVLRLALHAFGNQYPKEDVLRYLKLFYRRFFTQQFKRSCLPDGPKIGSVSLSPRGDWKMPSDALANLWLEEL